MWGNCPSCEAVVRFKDGSGDRSETYKASGYGYDKESTVISQVFNAYLKYKLYRELIPVKQWLNGKNVTVPYGISISNKYKYFDGGIGVNCYYDISEAIGGKFEKIAIGKMFDSYKYTDL